MPVATVFENLQDMSVDELIEEFNKHGSRSVLFSNLLRKALKLSAPRLWMLVLFVHRTP